MSQIFRKNYSSLAGFYGTLMKNIDYSLWAKYIIDITNEYKLTVNAMLEIGGGNGKLAKVLSRKFSDYFLSDISPQFLSNSVIKQKRICCDMMALPFTQHFDLVLAAFDTVNYLTSQKSFSKLLSEVSAITNDNGIFTFDVSLEKNSVPHIKGKKNVYNYLNQKIEHVSTYNPKNRVHKNEFTFYKSGKIVEKEIHKQKIFPFDFYLKQIEKSNFYIVDCLEAFGFRKGKPESKRVQFILKKVN
ncbi:MAG: methyltransferase domain-containing protein [Ignavibacteriaceae bacterium]|jgi:ubiquinone/menaquinone biosynthesis C-methylase UbiE